MSAQIRTAPVQERILCPDLPERPAGSFGVWMVDRSRWAVTSGEGRFDPQSAADLLGYVFQSCDGKWRIDGDPAGLAYSIAQHAVRDLVRFHETEDI